MTTILIAATAFCVGVLLSIATAPSTGPATDYWRGRALAAEEREDYWYQRSTYWSEVAMEEQALRFATEDELERTVRQHQAPAQPTEVPGQLDLFVADL